MKFHSFLAAAVLLLGGLVAPVAAVSAPAEAAARHACTHTSSGHCIHGGQFCPKASKNHSGYDAKGRRYVCRGGSHPHWYKP